MSTHEKRLSTLQAAGPSLSREAQSLLGEIRTEISTTAKSPESGQVVARAIEQFPEEPGRRKAVAPQNQYTDNNPYRDHVPYKDGYSDRYNDHRYKP